MKLKNKHEKYFPNFIKENQRSLKSYLSLYIYITILKYKKTILWEMNELSHLFIQNIQLPNNRTV